MFTVTVIVEETNDKGEHVAVVAEWPLADYQNAGDAVSAGQHVRTHRLPTSMRRIATKLHEAR